MNESIRTAFNKLWQHVLAALTNKSDVGHTHVFSDVIGLDDPSSSFYAVFGETTNADIEKAYQSNKALYCNVEDVFYSLIARVNETEHIFGYTNNSGWHTAICRSDEWEIYDHDFEGTNLDITSIAITESADSVTITNTLWDGSTEKIVVTKSASGNPAGISYNDGTTIPIDWTEVSE